MTQTIDIGDVVVLSVIKDQRWWERLLRRPLRYEDREFRVKKVAPRVKRGDIDEHFLGRFYKHENQ